MNVSGVHIAGRSCVMTCKSQTSWEGFPLFWKGGSGETPLDILRMSHLHCMFGDNMSEMVWIMSERRVWIRKRKQEIGMGPWFS